MCGRFTLRVTPAELSEFFDLFRMGEFGPRFNIAPTQLVACIRQGDEGRELAFLRWGLIPSWSKDTKIGASLINARSETAAEKPSFRAAMKRRRCLIPVDGFYEWQAIVGQKTKQPWLIGVRDVPLFAFAGLWETWTSPDGSPLETCSILTTAANELLQPMHDRMPVILEPAEYSGWLDPAKSKAEELLPFLDQFPAAQMYRYPVSSLVGSPKNERPECVTPIELA